MLGPRGDNNVKLGDVMGFAYHLQCQEGLPSPCGYRFRRSLATAFARKRKSSFKSFKSSGDDEERFRPSEPDPLRFDESPVARPLGLSFRSCCFYFRDER